MLAVATTSCNPQETLVVIVLAPLHGLWNHAQKDLNSVYLLSKWRGCPSGLKDDWSHFHLEPQNSVFPVTNIIDFEQDFIRLEAQHSWPLPCDENCCASFSAASLNGKNSVRCQESLQGVYSSSVWVITCGIRRKETWRNLQLLRRMVLTDMSVSVGWDYRWQIIFVEYELLDVSWKEECLLWSTQCMRS